MCCLNNPGSVRYLKRKMEKAGGWMTFWKVRRRGGNRGGGIYPLFGVGGWRSPGVKAAKAVMIGNEYPERVAKAPILERKAVHAGIHVYRYYEDAECNASVGGDCVLIPVRCHVGDLIAASEADWYGATAVFRKVTVGKRDYERAVRKV